VVCDHDDAAHPEGSVPLDSCDRVSEPTMRGLTTFSGDSFIFGGEGDNIPARKLMDWPASI
jgi:hypothetical protein